MKDIELNKKVAELLVENGFKIVDVMDFANDTSDMMTLYIFMTTIFKKVALITVEGCTTCSVLLDSGKSVSSGSYKENAGYAICTCFILANKHEN